jgi:oligopeptide/dipeptide ABC transporter ATP-binding protein
MIQTARGPIEPDALGLTLMHEHLCIVSDGVPQAFPRTFPREATVAEAIARVNEAANHGVQSILDLTVLGLGRDIALIAEVAAQVPVNILVATGAYTFDQLPPYFRSRPIDHLAEQFIADIEEGIADSGIRAAAIKCTTDAPGVTTDVEKLLRASARAQLATGVLLNTHSNPKARTGLDQLRIFREEGVDLRRVIIGHCGDTDDLDYLLEVADSGAFMGMDRFGIDASLPVDRRIAMVLELLERVRIPEPAAVARSFPHQLSGGMAQRVAIAAALAGRPRVLIADEPTTALDVTVQAEILELLRELRQRDGLAVILVSHDWGVIADVCDSALVMYAGQVVEEADIASIFRQPRHPYSYGLMASNPEHAAPRSMLPAIPGTVPAVGDWPRGCHFAARCPFATAECVRTRIPLAEVAPGHWSRCIHSESVPSHVRIAR